MELNRSDAYWKSIGEHIDASIYDLNNFSEKMCQSPNNLIRTDYLAIERLLQILIEAGIGLAKRQVKKLGQMVRSNAYDNFEILKDAKIITQQELLEWKSIIGFRNVLVHEYMDVERDILIIIVKNKLYHIVLDLFNRCKTL